MRAKLRSNQKGHHQERQNQSFFEKNFTERKIAGYFQSIEHKMEDEKLNMALSGTQGYVHFPR